MKLVGKLKEKVNKAETKEQAKELIANAGMELTDEEMDKVGGGLSDEEQRILRSNAPIAVGGDFIAEVTDANILASSYDKLKKERQYTSQTLEHFNAGY